MNKLSEKCKTNIYELDLLIPLDSYSDLTKLNPTMNEDDIYAIINTLAWDSYEAVQRGVKAIVLNVCPSSIVGKFLDPSSNMRTDNWGGSVNKRLHFLKVLIKACRFLIGHEIPILFKLDPENTILLSVECKNLGLYDLLKFNTYSKQFINRKIYLHTLKKFKKI